jgi:hypothetical protein
MEYLKEQSGSKVCKTVVPFFSTCHSGLVHARFSSYKNKNANSDNWQWLSYKPFMLSFVPPSLCHYVDI